MVQGEAPKDPLNPLVVLPAPILVQNREALENAACFLGLDPKTLSENLERRTVQVCVEIFILLKEIDFFLKKAVGRETFAHVTYSLKEANEARDTISRGLYSKLFSWIVGRINSSIAVSSGVAAPKFIALLDIFGFENFDVNSFDQLLINFGNEKLQHLFVEKVNHDFLFFFFFS